MLGPLLRIQEILLHRQANIVRLAGVCLATHRTKPIRNIVPDSRFNESGVRRITELLEAANVWDDLGNTDTHLLKLAEPEALSIRRGNPHICCIIEEVDLLVLEGEALSRDNQAIPIEVQRHLL